MLPNDQPEFYNLVTELFAVHGRVAQKPALNAWWVALKSRALPEVHKIIRRLIEESTELPTPARVIAMIRDDKPPASSEIHPNNIAPSKTTLMAARRHLEMFGEQEARYGFGDYAVNIILNNPKEGYSAVNPLTYGGTLPDHIKADLKNRVRLNDGEMPDGNLGNHLKIQ